MGSIPKEMILWKCKPAAAAIFRKETADANAAAIRICPAVPRDMNMSIGVPGSLLAVLQPSPVAEPGDTVLLVKLQMQV